MLTEVNLFEDTPDWVVDFAGGVLKLVFALGSVYFISGSTRYVFI